MAGFCHFIQDAAGAWWYLDDVETRLYNRKTVTSKEPTMQSITPYLWFDHRAEEAANFYCSIFPNSKVTNIIRNGEGGPGPAGSVMSLTFVLDGQEFHALNGGPHFKFNEAVSFFVPCETQAEVDRFWNALTADGGEESQCGWLKDKYGLSWQIVPNALMELMQDEDAAKAQRVTQAMLQMRKIDIQALQDAYAGV
jgi:predicted 3-demethylubiquinone-9 3-methyltransferase (glyoxalase superfamily)